LPGAPAIRDGDATIYVAAYRVFIAATVASMSSDPVQEKMRRGGDGGGTFDLGSRDAVTLTVTQVTTAGPRSHLRHATTGVHNRASTTLIAMRADRQHMHTAADQFRAGARHTDRRISRRAPIAHRGRLAGRPPDTGGCS
jgi:hypothetical protein